jgi:hypothetical protein
MSEITETELRVNAAVRKALETAAAAVERLSGNRHYQAAYKAAARTVRSLKPD